MGAPPALPFFSPQQVQAQPGVSHPIQGPAPGTLPYRMPALPGITQGLSDLVDSYHAHKQAKEAYYQDKFWNAVHMKMLGLGGSLDDQQIMHWAKLAGMPIKTRDAGQLDYEKQAQAYQQQMKQYAQTQAAANAVRTGRVQAAGLPAAQTAAGSPIGQALARIQQGTPAGNVPGAGMPGPMEQALQRIQGGGAAPGAGALPAALTAATGRAAGSEATAAGQLAPGGAVEGAGEPTAPTPYAPPPRPGLLGRMKQSFFGGGPPQAYNTDWLKSIEQGAGGGLGEQLGMQNLLQRAKTTADLGSLENQTRIQEIAKRALTDPEVDYPTLRRFGMAQSLGPMQDMIEAAPAMYKNEIAAGHGTAEDWKAYVGNMMMKKAMGYPEYQKMRADMLEHWAPRFVGREQELAPFVDEMLTYGRSQHNPGWTADEVEKVNNGVKALGGLYTKQTAGNLALPVFMELSGMDPDPAYHNLTALAEDPYHKGQFRPVGDPGRPGYFEELAKTQELKIRGQEAGAATSQAGTAQFQAETRKYEVDNQIRQHGMDIQIAAYNAIRAAGGEEFDRLHTLMKEGNKQQQLAAKQQMANLFTRMNKVSLDWGGVSMPIDDPMRVVNAYDVMSRRQAITPGSGVGIGALWGGEQVLAPTKPPAGQSGVFGAPGAQNIQPQQDPNAPIQGTAAGNLLGGWATGTRNVINNYHDVLGGIVGAFSPEGRKNALNYINRQVGGTKDLKDDFVKSIGDYSNQMFDASPNGGAWREPPTLPKSPVQPPTPRQLEETPQQQPGYGQAGGPPGPPAPEPLPQQ